MPAIAIDGPAGAGKSTSARALAVQIGYIYVDTGALYRTVALAIEKSGTSPDDTAAVSELLKKIKVEIAHKNGEQRVILNGADVSDEIRTPEISLAASHCSAIPEVRAFLLGLQRDIAAQNNVVMDGRDIGTVVLPNAEVKIFLTADPKERARRRYDELIAKGKQVTYDEVLRDMTERDRNDSNRAVAPLKPAPDSITVDTTGCNLEQGVAKLKAVVEEALK